ncbi:MAG: GHKL domain-containing protein [Clostridia bacterium]|nr:GHKL domain-containing protein [Clostridia bacterium]
MDYIRTIAYLTAYAVNTYAHFLIIEAILHKENRRLGGKALFSGYFAFYAIRGAIYLFLPLNTYLNLAMTIAGLILLCFMYRASMLKRLIAAAYALAPGMVSDAGTGATIAAVMGTPTLELFASNSMYTAMLLGIQAAITIALTLLCMRLFRRHGDGDIDPPKSYQITSFLIPMLSMILVYDWMYRFALGNEIRFETILLCTVLLLAINVLTFYMYERIRNEEQDRYELALASKQSEAYAHQAELMKKSAKNLKLIRHDIKNHCISLEYLAKEGRTDEILEYIGRLRDVTIVQEEYVHSGLLPLDGIMNYKLAEAKEAGADIQVSVQVPDSLGVDGSDLVIILGNLMDNAIEGLSRSREKILQARLYLEKDVFYIVIRNSYDGEVRLAKGRNDVYLTRKERPESHGFGIISVRKALDRYNGVLKLEHDESFFTAKAILYPKGVER